MIRSLFFHHIPLACGLGLLAVLSLPAQEATPVQVDFADAALREWVQPDYPEAAKKSKLKGEAQIEFIIDREGRVRLPRVKSASREEFGWAAATAISQWVFERPMRKGEPVDVIVNIPVSFAPPKS